MHTYWILPYPGTSAVFFDASEGLALAELSLCLKKLTVRCEAPGAAEKAGLRWYTFQAADILGMEDIRRIAMVSCVYALFAEEDALFAPVPLLRDAPFGDDLSGILKYTGKTNALFTRTMLGIAVNSLAAAPTGKVRLLDPVAGKGTTLFEALMRGWDAAGIEIVQRAAHESAVYFQKYLETEKWKHKLQKIKSYGAPTWQIAFAQDKDALKTNPGHWQMVAGDSKHADRYYGKAAFDIIAGDLPYGVAHGNIAGAAPSRSPAALLKACLPAWRTALKAGGVLALSWNTHVFSADEMVQLIESYGLACLRDAPYDGLAHRVDAAIRRDIVIAVKGGGNI